MKGRSASVQTTNAIMHWTDSKRIAHRGSQQGKQAPGLLDTMNKANSAYQTEVTKKICTYPIHKVFIWSMGGKKKREKKGQSTLIWSYSGSILSHAQEYLKPTVLLNSPLYQLQYYILMINSVKNYFHSFWMILCTEYFRNEYFIFSTWISARFVHC